MKKLTILLLLTGILTAQTHAQNARPGGGPPPAAGAGIVKGMVHDSTSDGAIEYATVGIYRERDSTLANGAVTDPSGAFIIKGLTYGSYYLEASFIGYTKRLIPKIIITPQSTTVDIGMIALHPDITQIKDVEIVAQSNRVEYKIDKKVVNVSQDISAAGGTLVNVLENTPSVQVDVEGNVSLRGSGNFQLLIDGKPSVIQGSEGLQQIPASAVQSLEIITSPSAKYDPDGEAGIINVIMKKQKNSGVGGVMNVSIGSKNKYSADFLLNFKRDKLNFYLGGEWADQKNYNYGEGERRTYGDTTTFYLTDQEGVFHRQNLNLKSGFDYYINDNSTLSLSGAISERNFSRDFETKTHWFTEPSSRDSFYIDEGISTDKDNAYNINLDFVKKYAETDHNLQASIYYAYSKEVESEDEIVRPADSEFNPTGSEPVRTRSSTDQPETNLRFELDYVQPVGAHKMELGLQSRWDNVKADYIYEDYQPLGNEWLRNDTISNSLDYLDAIQSAYSTLSGPLGKFEYQLGLRAEYDNRSLKQLTSDEIYTYEKFHFFPSLYITKKFGESHQLQLNFSRRIQRPDERDLNPFKEFRGSINVFYGNPALKPEFTNAYELNYQYNFKKGFVSFEAYYRTTNDKITRINGVDSLNGKQVFTFTSINADQDKTLGMELMANMDITKWWQLNLTGNLFRYELQGMVDGADKTSVSTSWRTNFNSTFKLIWDTRLQVTGFYNGPSETLQGQRDGFFVANLALRKDLLKKQLSVSLSARDIFSTGVFSFTSESDDFYTYNKFHRESPVVTLQLTYRINNYRQATRRSDNGEGQDGGGGMDIGI